MHHWRYAEIDLARSVAVALMIVYHAAFDLSFFFHWNISLESGAWKALQLTVACLFLSLVGVSASILYGRMRREGATHASIWRRFLKRAVIVLVCAVPVSLATWVIAPGSYVRFGVLHLIGIALIFLPALLPLKEWNMLLGFLIVTANTFIEGIVVPTSLFIPLNLLPADYQSLDHYPLVPWLGVILMGAGIGHATYIRLLLLGPSRLSMTVEALPLWLRSIFLWPGRHSLFVYLVHQPILLPLLWLLFGGH